MSTTKPKSKAKSRATRKAKVGSVNVPGYSRSVNSDMYEAARAALWKVLPRKAPGVTQREMFAAAKRHLPEELFPGGDKAEWWIKSVQLDLEAKGLVARDAKAKPLRWWRTTARKVASGSR